MPELFIANPATNRTEQVGAAFARAPTQPRPIQGGKLENTAALCLSGGGFRAMLFHGGALIRLNELGYLPHLNRVSSVSGGSIAAAILAVHWPHLTFNDDGVASNFERVVHAIDLAAGLRIDAIAGLTGLLNPFSSAAHGLARSLRRNVLVDNPTRLTLQDLPDTPRFVFCATNTASGVLLRFAKPYMADYQIGKRTNPTVTLDLAVAASAAFPPYLSPLTLQLSDSNTLTEAFDPNNPPPLHRPPYQSTLRLTDGGVYDNLGIQPANQNNTVFVSDGGTPFRVRSRPGRTWLGHTVHCWRISDKQVRSRRRSELLNAFQVGQRYGALWGIDIDGTDYPHPSPVATHLLPTTELANLNTRLWRLDPQTRADLINWGYTACDSAVRSYFEAAPPEIPLPFPVQT